MDAPSSLARLLRRRLDSLEVVEAREERRRHRRRPCRPPDELEELLEELEDPDEVEDPCLLFFFFDDFFPFLGLPVLTGAAGVVV